MQLFGGPYDSIFISRFLCNSISLKTTHQRLGLSHLDSRYLKIYLEKYWLSKVLIFCTCNFFSQLKEWNFHILASIWQNELIISFKFRIIGNRICKVAWDRPNQEIVSFRSYVRTRAIVYYSLFSEKFASCLSGVPSLAVSEIASEPAS